MFGAVCSTSREESCRRIHMVSWGRVPRYDRILSGVLELKDLSGLMILLINTLMTMSSVFDSGPRRAFLLMLRRLESQCTGGSDVQGKVRR